MNSENPESFASLPSFSVVVPVYNGQATIRACIESLLAQEYPKDLYEIIIVDNNSTDNTKMIVEEYPVQLLCEKMQSAYAARNTGILAASKEIVALTDADCEADPHWLQKLGQHFSSNDIVGVAGQIASYASTNLVDEFQGSTFQYVAPERDEPLAIPTGNVAYRRQAMLEVGLFDPSFLIGGDIDLSWRIQDNSRGRAVYEPEAVVFHKHYTTVSQLFKQRYGYGYGDIVLIVLFKHKKYRARTPKVELFYILKQIWAMIIYIRSFVYRTITWPIHRRNKKYILWPLLWLVVEGATLLGKVHGLMATRWFQKNPYSNRA